MPGPALTESRWAPAMITLLGSPSLLSASTLEVVAMPRKVSVFKRMTRPDVAANCWPTSCVTAVTEMSRVKVLLSVPFSVPGMLL